MPNIPYFPILSPPGTPGGYRENWAGDGMIYVQVYGTQV